MINHLTYKNIFISGEIIDPCHLNMVNNGLYNFVHHLIGMTKSGWYKGYHLNINSSKVAPLNDL